MFDLITLHTSLATRAELPVKKRFSEIDTSSKASLFVRARHTMYLKDLIDPMNRRVQILTL
jgi:hypothetical protein